MRPSFGPSDARMALTAAGLVILAILVWFL